MGTFARHEGKFGKTAMPCDCDGDVRLEWADGSGISNYVNLSKLVKATQAQYISEQWPVGTLAKIRGRVGKTSMSPNSDTEVLLEWADGSGISGFVSVATLAKATQAEWDAAVRAVCPFTSVRLHFA